MTRYRPPAVLVMAILNMVFGALGIFGLLCIGLMFLIMPQLPQPPGGNPAIKVFEVPAYKQSVFVFASIGAVLAILEIIAGIGLLRMKTWGRRLSIGYAVTTIVIQVIGLVVNIAYVNPKIAEVMAQDTQQPFAQMQSNPMVGNIGTGFGAVLGMAYAVALLIVMFRPHVRAAFAEAQPPAGPNP